MDYDPEEQALEDNPKLRAAVFGRQVEIFLESDIGQYLLQCAQIDVEKALEKLKRVNPRDVEAVQNLQNDIRVAESIVGWLSDAINSGKQATEALKESP